MGNATKAQTPRSAGRRKESEVRRRVRAGEKAILREDGALVVMCESGNPNLGVLLTPADGGQLIATMPDQDEHPFSAANVTLGAEQVAAIEALARQQRLAGAADGEEALEPVEREEALSLLGEGIHSSLRNGCESGAQAWAAIEAMEDEQWSAALAFLVDGLGQMGFVLAKRGV
jgi:hypothetical protein